MCAVVSASRPRGHPGCFLGAIWSVQNSLREQAATPGFPLPSSHPETLHSAWEVPKKFSYSLSGSSALRRGGATCSYRALWSLFHHVQPIHMRLSFFSTFPPQCHAQTRKGAESVQYQQNIPKQSPVSTPLRAGDKAPPCSLHRLPGPSPNTRPRPPRLLRRSLRAQAAQAPPPTDTCQTLKCIL